MGLQIEQIEGPHDPVETVFIQQFQSEMRREIEVLKKRIAVLENRLEDPFG